MKLLLLAVGKPHESYIREGVVDFTARLNKYFPVEWKIIPPVKNASTLSVHELKKAEAKPVHSLLLPDDVLILLDERGKNISSPELAALLQSKANASARRLVFLIGGAFGVDNGLKQKAGFVWSLSQLVFPHMLVRLILAEQLYRACTILKNEKYHHV